MILSPKQYLGHPCRACGRTERYVKGRQCVECRLVQKARWREKHPKALVLDHPRVLARAAGLKTYLAKDCTAGHVGVRYVSSGSCVQCERDKVKRRHADRLKRGVQVTVPKKPSAEVERAKRRAKAVLYRARRRAAKGKHTATDIAWLRDKQGGKCGLCLLPIKKGDRWEADHRVALVCGGSNERRNMQILHLACNRSKGKLGEIEYAQRWLGRLL